jgi:hypothetical protein
MTMKVYFRLPNKETVSYLTQIASISLSKDNIEILKETVLDPIGEGLWIIALGRSFLVLDNDYTVKKNKIDYFKCMQHAGWSPVTHHTTPSRRDWMTIDHKHTLQSIYSTLGRSAETYPTTLSHRDWD